eukprot:1953704-Pleurochrysis_carterae.AAC.2
MHVVCSKATLVSYASSACSKIACKLEDQDRKRETANERVRRNEREMEEVGNNVSEPASKHAGK